MDNIHTTAYNGTVGWHGKGNAITDPSDTDHVREVSGLDYTLERAIVQYNAGDTLCEMADKHVIYRSDTLEPLSVMGNGYHIVQPADVVEIFREMCDSQGWVWETAGSLGKGGKKYWGLAKTPLDDSINGDQHQLYYLMFSSCDGSLATGAVPTAIRVVCQNTLQAAIYSAGDELVKIRHSSEYSKDDMLLRLGLIDEETTWLHFRDSMLALQERRISPEEGRTYFETLLRPKARQPKARQEAGAKSFADLMNADMGGGTYKTVVAKPPREIRGMGDLINSYENAPGARPGTAYGLLQGVTHWVDHTRGKKDDMRTESAFFGNGKAMKQRALDAALDLAA